MLGKAVGVATADDEVIEHAHIDKGHGFLDPLRDAQVRLARCRISRRVVGGEDDRRRIEFQTASGDLPRVDRCAVNGAEEQVLDGNQTMPIVQEHTGEDLGGLLAVVKDQVIRNGLGRGEDGSAVTAIGQGGFCGPDDLVWR